MHACGEMQRAVARIDMLQQTAACAGQRQPLRLASGCARTSDQRVDRIAQS